MRTRIKKHQIGSFINDKFVFCDEKTKDFVNNYNKRQYCFVNILGKEKKIAISDANTWRTMGCKPYIK